MKEYEVVMWNTYIGDDMKSRINEMIELRGYKKKWVASRLGVSQEVLSRWINDRSKPSLDNAFKLSHILNCKVDDLYTSEDDKRK